MSKVTFPDVALPPPGAPGRPLEDVVFYWILAEHPALTSYGLTVDLALAPSARSAPFIRVGVVRHLEPARPGESTPIAALDVYAESSFTAEEIAQTISRVWPFLRRVSVPTEDAYVSGAWVEVEPYALAEPDEGADAETLSRFHLEVGLRLHPLPPGA